MHDLSIVLISETRMLRLNSLSKKRNKYEHVKTRRKSGSGRDKASGLFCSKKKSMGPIEDSCLKSTNGMQMYAMLTSCNSVIVKCSRCSDVLLTGKEKCPLNPTNNIIYTQGE